LVFEVLSHFQRKFAANSVLSVLVEEFKISQYLSKLHARI